MSNYLINVKCGAGIGMGHVKHVKELCDFCVRHAFAVLQTRNELDSQNATMEMKYLLKKLQELGQGEVAVA